MIEQILEIVKEEMDKACRERGTWSGVSTVNDMLAVLHSNIRSRIEKEFAPPTVHCSGCGRKHDYDVTCDQAERWEIMQAQEALGGKG